MKFSEFNFTPTLEEAISYMGYETASEVQEKAIPIIQNGDDIIACAQTGTGKTAAFLLPVLDFLGKNDNKANKIRVLIITPTRELAMQIDQQVEAFSYFLGVNSITVYGGGDKNSFVQQKKAFNQGADIIVATPGRLIAHMQLGYVDFKSIDFLILDEADRMLDMGFYTDIIKIEKETNPKKQVLMFSATMPSNIRQLAKKILNNHKEVSVAISKPAEKIIQAAYLVYDRDKPTLIRSLLKVKSDSYKRILIFCSTKKMINELVRVIRTVNTSVEGISSDLDQKEREKVLQQFSAGTTNILVATDILSRGIDISDINLVINYDVPAEGEDYIHRIGRTARASGSGVALTLISEKGIGRFKRIEKLIGDEIPKMSLPPEIKEGPSYTAKRGGYNSKRNYSGKKKYYKKR